MLAFDGGRAIGRGARRRRGGDASADLGRRRPRPAIRSLAALGTEIASAPKLESIVYLSSLGVYGDHDGAWVDETATTIPAHARGGARLAAEQAWQALGRQRGVPVAVLRLAGIYGPGQNVFTRLLAGRAHRVAKPGHVFNRIHVADIAQAIDAAFAQQAPTASSTSPTTSPRAYSDQVLMAAELLGIDPPKELSMEEARTDPHADGAELLCRLRAGAERQAQDARSA